MNRYFEYGLYIAGGIALAAFTGKNLMDMWKAPTEKRAAEVTYDKFAPKEEDKKDE